jgi:hypothetical protein
MGYRSDVLLAVVVETPSQADELMATYAMHPIVQALDLAKEWQRKQAGQAGAPYTVLLFEAENLKWYEGYGDVQGYEHMLTLAKTFGDERGIDKSNDDPNELVICWPFATAKIRIGEDDTDIETDYNSNQGSMESFVYDAFGVRREIINTL